jgi:putative molybdopterin biosynthesis protein
MADCGFGVEAAARQQHLDFVPVATERYYLATRKTALERPGPRALLAALSGRPVARMLAALPGYRAAPGVEPIDARIALT